MLLQKVFSRGVATKFASHNEGLCVRRMPERALRAVTSRTRAAGARSRYGTLSGGCSCNPFDPELPASEIFGFDRC